MRNELIHSRKNAPYLVGVLLLLSFSIMPIVDSFSQDPNAVADVSTNNEDTHAYVSGLTSARARSLVGGVIGLMSVVIGWRSRSRQNADRIKSKTWPKIGLVLSGIAIVLSVAHLAMNKGAFGTGGGKAGAIVALVLGIGAVILNGLALRSERK